MTSSRNIDCACGALAGQPHNRPCSWADTKDCPENYYDDALSRGIGDVKSDARGSGARFNSGKPPVELIPVWLIASTFRTRPISPVPDTVATSEALEILELLGYWQQGQTSARHVLTHMTYDWWTDCANVFDYGRKKYAEWNWAKGMKWSVPLACAVRHCLAILRGEENDPESGLPHRGHVACNIVMLAQFEQTYREGDDRPRLLWPDIHLTNVSEVS